MSFPHQMKYFPKSIFDFIHKFFLPTVKLLIWLKLGFPTKNQRNQWAHWSQILKLRIDGFPLIHQFHQFWSSHFHEHRKFMPSRSFLYNFYAYYILFCYSSIIWNVICNWLFKITNTVAIYFNLSEIVKFVVLQHLWSFYWVRFFCTNLIVGKYK